jgi:hypothetical protein
LVSHDDYLLIFVIDLLIEQTITIVDQTNTAKTR